MTRNGFSRRGLVPQFLPQALAPNLRGSRFNLNQDLNGGFLMEINGEHIRMEPKQAYELACTIFGCVGISADKIPLMPVKGAGLIRTV